VRETKADHVSIAVLAIENCLIKDLTSMFSPTLTANMEDEQLQDIAAECEEVRNERSNLKQKLEVLYTGKKILREHMGKPSHSFLPVCMLNVVTARTPMIRTKATSPFGRRNDHPRRPVTPTRVNNHSQYDASADRVNATADLAYNLDELTITPPVSRRGSARPSHCRVDSAIGTPSPDADQRKRSPLPLQYRDQKSHFATDDSEEEL
jgi:hypothetical protein